MAREPTERGAAWLRPHAPVAERVIVPGDPGRALRLAQALTEGPKMLNHNRGLWGYTGTAADGLPLTIQSTGLGGASAAAVVADLAALGARRLVRAGTCVPLREVPAIAVAGPVLALDGASRALGGPPELRGEVTVASTDLTTEAVPEEADVRDLTSGAVASAARAHALEVAVVLLTGPVDEAAEIELGRRALALLG